MKPGTFETVDLRWRRCIDGYRFAPGWTSEEHKTGATIFKSNVANIAPISKRFETYRPLQIPALFAVFARTEPNADGMLEFCNKFGVPKPLAAGLPMGTVNAFLREHRTIRRALSHLEQGDPSELIKHQGELVTLHVQLVQQPNNRLAFALTPADLLSAMWYQLALHACDGTKLFTCERCNKPFIVGSGTKRRSTAKYCSPACGNAAWRASQKG